MWEYNYTDELYHHGVKGMRWGVRRAQKKANYSSNRSAKKAEKKQFKKDVKAYRKAKGIIDFEVSNRGEVRNVRARTSDVLKDAKVRKGQAYADRIVKKSNLTDRALLASTLIGGGAAMAGLAYLQAKFDYF